MRAWQATTLGEPADVMRLAEVGVPTPEHGQILVRVRAAALNFPDVLMCRGQYQVRPPLPFTPGVELCGEIVEGAGGGPGGSGFQLGARVIGSPVLPHGALAEYAVMDPITAFPAPESLDDASASSLFIAYQTGWFALHRRARLQAGETLLVHAAAGGVGSAAVQLGKAAGARVIAVVGGAEKAVVARDLGADEVIDRRVTDFVAAVKELTDGRGADVVFDPVGGDAYAGSTKCVAFEGRILVIGFASGVIPTAALNHALIKNYSIVGLHWNLYMRYDPAAIGFAHQELTRLAGEGLIAPLVSDRLPLERAVDGLTRLAAGDTVGRVVVTP
jgi:NADPH:quinone reductase